MVIFCRTSDAQDQAPILDALWIEAYSPTFSFFAPAPKGPRHSPTGPLRVLGHNRKWIVLETEKENSGCQGKEGASITHKTSGERMVCPGQIPPPLVHGKRCKAQTQGGLPSTLLPQDEAVAPSNPGEGRSLEAELPGPWDRWGSPTACGVLNRRFSSG